MKGCYEWVRTNHVSCVVIVFVVFIYTTMLYTTKIDSWQIRILKSAQILTLDTDIYRNFSILFYTYPDWFKRDTSKINFFKDCKYKNCNVTFNHSMLLQSDAVIFYHVGMNQPPTKLSNQIWIFVSLESPYTTKTTYNREGFKNKFDWTMTYRQDSEGFIPYGVIKRRNKVLEKNYKSIFQNKTKEAVWVVSHCNTISKREKYIQEMAKYIGVDTFGRCGQSCNTNSAEDCKQKLSKIYKFYLSFENALCNDYMTEKISTIYLDDMNFIPVVRGAPNASNYLPKNTYVSTTDFTTPKELAEYLKNLGRNETLYTDILKEKDKYYYQSNSHFEGGMCDICRLLNNNYTTQAAKDLEQWLWKGQCTDPKDI